MRIIFITAGWIYYFFQNKKKEIKKLYFQKLYASQLKTVNNYSFEKNFNLVIDPDSEVFIMNGVHFSDSCCIKTINGGKVSIGENTFFNIACSVTSFNNVKIGANCLFGENVKIYDHNHKFNNYKILIKDQGYSFAPVHIGNNVWIGSHVTILKGVTIGDNCVIGAGCVINKNIAPNSIVKLSQTQNIESIKKN